MADFQPGVLAWLSDLASASTPTTGVFTLLVSVTRRRTGGAAQEPVPLRTWRTGAADHLLAGQQEAGGPGVAAHGGGAGDGGRPGAGDTVPQRGRRAGAAGVASARGGGVRAGHGGVTRRGRAVVYI